MIKIEIEKERKFWVDLLRIFAAIAVIGLHFCSSGSWYEMPVNSSEWLMLNFYSGLTKWCVPVFVMISGVIFLNPQKEITIKSIYTKYIPRLVVSYIVWSAFYVLFSNFNRLPNFDMKMLNEFVNQFIKGHYHMWYIPTIIGIYLITPILRKVVSNCDKKTIEYFLILWLVFAIIIPTITIYPYTQTITAISKKLGMTFVMNFSGYYVLGYYLSTINYTKKVKWFLYISGIVGAVLTVGISTTISLLSGKPNNDFYGNSSPNVVLMSIGIFAFFKQYVSSIKVNDRLKKITSQISLCSFGIYLCHPLFLSIFMKFGLNINKFHPLFSVPIFVISIFILSCIFTWIIRRFKFARNYLT